MRLAACFAEGFHLIIERFPIPGQHVPPRDHDIDLTSARFDAFLDLCHSQVERRQSRREPRRDRSDRQARSGKCLNRRLDHVVIDTDRTHRQPLHAQRVEQIRANGLPRLGTQTIDPSNRVVPRQRRQIDAGDRPAQPRGLMRLFDGPPPRERRRTPFNRRAVRRRTHHPVEVQLHPGVARLQRLRKLHRIGRGLHAYHSLPQCWHVHCRSTTRNAT